MPTAADNLQNNIRLPIHRITAAISSEADLSTGWEIRHLESKGLLYYFHPQAKESRWKPPSGTDPEKLKLYKGMNHSTQAILPDGNGQRATRGQDQGSTSSREAPRLEEAPKLAGSSNHKVQRGGYEHHTRV
ncbi:peptidyl-prolyl cis-trans isomerase Pin1 [Elasticomyces elasticus]|nr:peptidyl-prolyl cis-trans isomerase Pin1 [Elasticomyces elasticus]